MSLIKVKQVSKHYGLVKALCDFSVDFDEGKQYVIQGASGSGKSTLLYLLAGLDRPTKGQIIVGEQDLATLNDEALAHYRNRKVGLVFQFHFLLPSMNCLDNILLPAKIGSQNIGTIKKECIELAKVLGVEHCLKKYPYQLSGGEQQRINIIRALSLRPKCLLCDEPTGNLDSENSQKVIHVIKELAHSYGATLIVVTHDGAVAQQFDHSIKVVDGKGFIESR